MRYRLGSQHPGGQQPPSLRCGLALTLSLLVLFPIVAGGSSSPTIAQTATGIRAAQYWLQDYGIDQAWQSSRGAGVTVAVIDSGVDATHPDLAGQVAGGKDFSGEGSNDGQTPVGAGADHGTMVASLLAGTGSADDGQGLIGVAPEADLLSVSVGFEGAPDSDQQIADAIVWAVDNGADIINMSFSRDSKTWPRSWDDAFAYAEEKDVMMVAAAGNRSSGADQVGAPATIPGVLTVGGVARGGRASWDASSQGITLGVMAPSEQLIGAVPGGGYRFWSGTSGATPLVSGLAALIMSAQPELDVANVINRILETADRNSDQVPDPLYGYGTMDAAAALTSEVASVRENPLGSMAEWIDMYRPSADGQSSGLGEPQPIPTASPEGQDMAANTAWVAKTSIKATTPFIVWGVFLLLMAFWLLFVIKIVRRSQNGE